MVSRPIALYYPNIHVRDETWLKYAALYWPKLGRLRPRDYPTYDSTVARYLHNENWLISLAPPPWAAYEVGAPFVELISERARDLQDRFGLYKIESWATGRGGLAGRSASPIGYDNAGIGYDRTARSAGRHLDPRLAYVHVSKVAPRVIAATVDTGLATTAEGRGGLWVGMHPELASVYTCALIERIAIADQLHPVTDQPLPHSALSGWSLERLMDALLPQSAAEPTQRPDATDAFVLLAFETVVPANLAEVPIEKIIEIRAKFGTELDTFREYVAAQADQLAGLADIRDATVFGEYLRTEVQDEMTARLRQLRERLRSVGVDSVKALANVKSVALPPLAEAGAHLVGLTPAVAGPAVLAACVLSAPVHWRRKRTEAIRQSPAGYLFQVEHALNPGSLLDRLRKAWPGSAN